MWGKSVPNFVMHPNMDTSDLGNPPSFPTLFYLSAVKEYIDKDSITSARQQPWKLWPQGLASIFRANTCSSPLTTSRKRRASGRSIQMLNGASVAIQINLQEDIDRYCLFLGLQVFSLCKPTNDRHLSRTPLGRWSACKRREQKNAKEKTHTVSPPYMDIHLRNQMDEWIDG